MSYKSSLSSYLLTLFHTIKEIQISGYLAFPLRDGSVVEEDFLRRFIDSRTELVNMKINNLEEEDFFSKLNNLSEISLNDVRSNINPSALISQTFVQYQGIVRDIDNLIELITEPSDYEIRFENSNEESRQEPYYLFEKLSYLKYKSLFDKIIKDYLKPLRRKLTDDLELLKNTSPKDFSLAFSKVEIRPTEYIIELDKITSLYKVIEDEVLDKLPFKDFLECFDYNNIPKNIPQNYKYKQGMVYALSLIDIRAKIALSHFGIKNYDQMKAKKMGSDRNNLKKSIDKALKINNGDLNQR